MKKGEKQEKKHFVLTIIIPKFA